MQPAEIKRNNYTFFFIAVAVAITNTDFAEAICKSFIKPEVYTLADKIYDGCIEIDSSHVVNQCSHGSLANAIEEGLLKQITMRLSEVIMGDMSTDATIIHEDYTFTFKITKYIRHNSEIVEDPSPLPDGEILGRFITLTISITNPS